jgi:hypothetical protein
MAPARKTNIKSRGARKSTPATKKKAKLHVATASKATEDAKEVDEEVIEASVVGLKDNDDYKISTSDDETKMEEAASTRKQSPSKKKKSSSDKTSLDATTRKWMERAQRAKRQLKIISKWQIINEFQDREVRQYAKQVLWKKVKFITSDNTMVRCMKEAATAFKIMATDQQDWMSTYSHSVHEAINAQRNHCCQELRKTVLSKWTQQ